MILTIFITSLSLFFNQLMMTKTFSYHPSSTLGAFFFSTGHACGLGAP
jgi:hypothetical protein